MGFASVAEFRKEGAEYVPYVLDDNNVMRAVAWAPQPGSQELFLMDPTVEVLYEGTRGPGKTDALIMDFCQEVGKGWGAEWKGILFRRTHPQLRDIIEKSKKWIKRIWPDAIYNEVKTMWEWPTGERLYFAHFDVASQYNDYHGHAYPWIGWEELTTWATPDCYKVMFACSRSTIKGMPRKVRATTNPYGVGHNWVKARFKLPINGLINGKRITVGPLITDSVDKDGNPEPPRRAIHGYLDENVILLHADPEYKGRIRAAARNASELAAWMDGSWDIVAGGMFDDIWYEYKDTIVVQPFPIPPGWKIYRAYDHGSSKPFSVGWYAISDGTDLKLPDFTDPVEKKVYKGGTRATVRGDRFRFKEWYGWRSHQPNEGTRMLVADISKGIIEREIKWGLRAADASWTRVSRGPADTQIFDDNANGSDISIATDFEKPVTINGVKHRGIFWERADKGSGSREQGWEQIRKCLKATKRPPGGFREIPGLFITTECVNWLRCVPVLPRDELKIDDVDDESEDHNGDETRYMLRFEARTMSSGRVGA
jgi:hypothetical protein